MPSRYALGLTPIVLVLVSVPSAYGQTYLPFKYGSRGAPQSVTMAAPAEVIRGAAGGLPEELEGLLHSRGSTRRLLDLLERAFERGELNLLGRSGLAWATTTVPGWRWERTDAQGERIILAMDGPLLVAIRQAKRIEMSIKDLSDGEAIPRGYANTPRYFGHRRSTVHISAFDEDHLARKSAEMFQYFYYFAGPTRGRVEFGAPAIPVIY